MTTKTRTQKPETVTLYHATSEYSLPRILTEGIRTSRELPKDAFDPEEWELYGKHISPQISLTDDLEEALTWNDAVVVVSIPKYWTHKRFDP